MPEVHRRNQFTDSSRDMLGEDRISLTSVGVDIGSSTSHLFFSSLELEREDDRYVIASRSVLHQSEILLTPYLDETTIDNATLGRFIHEQYEAAGLEREDVDTGALILTGVALDRRNAKAVAELFAEEAGRFVAVSAGDNLEATLAAHGSGAVAGSARDSKTIVNVDVGGGTTKLALCREGSVAAVAAMDVGARLIVVDDLGKIVRLEDAGRRVLRAIGLDLGPGDVITPEESRSMAAYMADQLFTLLLGGDNAEGPPALMRTPTPDFRGNIEAISFSGGVSEFLYGDRTEDLGDLGATLAEEIRTRVEAWGIAMLEPGTSIRATVIGASQYTVQLSGSTIYLSRSDIVPLKSIPVVKLDLPLDVEDLDAGDIGRSIRDSLERFDLLQTGSPLALAFEWGGSATFDRIRNFCSGVVEGMRETLAQGNPLILVSDGDVGGLLGLHLSEEMELSSPVISIDGIDLREFDYIDVGSLIPSSGAVPVVVKSLVFPAAELDSPVNG